jgi:hypothetical protein
MKRAASPVRRERGSDDNPPIAITMRRLAARAIYITQIA